MQRTPDGVSFKYNLYNKTVAASTNEPTGTQIDFRSADNIIGSVEYDVDLS